VLSADGSKVTVKSILAEESGERAPNVHGILMDYAEGSDLAAQVEKAAAEHKMSVDEAWHVFRQVRRRRFSDCLRLSVSQRFPFGWGDKS
jgi:hypothetical protein